MMEARRAVGSQAKADTAVGELRRSSLRGVAGSGDALHEHVGDVQIWDDGGVTGAQDLGQSSSDLVLALWRTGKQKCCD